MSSIVVQPAAECEAPACLALLPEARGTAAEFLIARLDGALAGAAAVVWRSWSEPPGFPLSIQVVPALRRRGVGRALLAAAAELANGETDGLWSLGALDEAGPAADFLRACGFSARRRQFEFAGDIGATHRQLDPLLTRLRARNRVSPDARIMPLSEAPMGEAAWLVSAELGGGPVRMLEALRQGTSNADGQDRSLAMMDGDQLAAVLIGRVDGGVLEVAGRVVAPAWRNGWVNVMLMHDMADRALADGLRGVRYHCDDSVADTISLARKVGAVQTRTAAHFYQAIAAT